MTKEIEEDFSLSPKEKDAALRQLQYELKMEAEEKAAEQDREERDVVRS